MKPVIPIVLFAYARPDYLRRTLACLHEEQVPLIYAFSDAPKTPEVADNVKEVRRILHEIDWCEVQIVERSENFGLGWSILSGVAEVLARHNAIIVFEDDLLCIPGTYAYLCAALDHYENDENVMSVTGWTHPLTTPSTVVDQPYFDGRTECYVWGTWRRAWWGMDRDALSLLQECEKQGIDIYRYGADLVKMAQLEKKKNIWAVRFSYLHILRQGICLRPPYSLVQHIGYDVDSANIKSLQEYKWHVELPPACPPIPSEWPIARENPECSILWQRECGTKPSIEQRPKSKRNYFAAWVKYFSQKQVKDNALAEGDKTDDQMASNKNRPPG